MADPKQVLRGAGNLGQAIDERIGKRRGQYDLRHSMGQPPGQHIGGGGFSGGGAPAFPESYVESLRDGDGGTSRSGKIVLEHEGVGNLVEGTSPSGDSRFTWQGKSLMPVASLPGNPDGEMVYLLNGAALYWHDSSSWQRLDSQLESLRLYLAGDSGTPQEIGNGDTVAVGGGDGITTSAGATDKVMVEVDSSVVRTNGDQSIGGVKSFTSFPVTPSSAPGSDYQAANKKYVDDESAAACAWQRNSTVLSPKTAGDRAKVEGVDALLSGAVEAKNSNSNGYGVVGRVGTPSHHFSTQGHGVLGESGSAFGVAGSSSANHGVAGTTGSAANNHYSLYAAERLKIGDWADSDEQSSEPATPPAGNTRWFSMGDGRAYAKDSSGNLHDLTVQHRQVFWAAGNLDSGQYDLNLSWAAGAVSNGAGQATVIASSACSFSSSADTNPAILSDSFARFEWEGVAENSELAEQAKMMAGAPCIKFGGRATVRARIRLNSAGANSAFASVFLTLNDTGSNSSSTANLLSSMPANTWYEAVLADVDVSDWANGLRIVVTAAGTADPDDAGQCVVDVEYLAVEQWQY